MSRRARSFGLFALLACACAGESLGDPPYDRLSDYGFFDGDLAAQEPAAGVEPFEVNAPLWADHAGKGRFFVLPDGGTIEIGADDEWQFPEGTTLIKSFYFDTDRSDTQAGEAHLVETRLLVREPVGWTPYIYLWDDAQRDAERLRAGDEVALEFTDETGQAATQTYIVPDENTCETCHKRDDVVLPLGPITHQMNKGNQIDAWAQAGLFASPPAPSAMLPRFEPPDGAADLELRARAYLHGNCAHCHRPGGEGGPSGLKFAAWETDPAQFGVCKTPSAAGPGTGGFSFDIVPGNPAESILVYRMASEDPEIKMPELPSLLSDGFGVDLVSEWITGMAPQSCG